MAAEWLRATLWWLVAADLIRCCSTWTLLTGRWFCSHQRLVVSEGGNNKIILDWLLWSIFISNPFARCHLNTNKLCLLCPLIVMSSIDFFFLLIFNNLILRISEFLIPISPDIDMCGYGMSSLWRTCIVTSCWTFCMMSSVTIELSC